MYNSLSIDFQALSKWEYNYLIYCTCNFQIYSCL